MLRVLSAFLVDNRYRFYNESKNSITKPIQDIPSFGIRGVVLKKTDSLDTLRFLEVYEYA